MVVTSSTAECESQEGSSHRIDLLVNDVRLFLHGVFFRQDLRPECEKPGRRCGGAMIEGWRNLFRKIASNLPADKVVERKVVIPSVHGPVAISKRVRIGVILVASI